MACDLFTTLAITATLLGNQGLKLESQVESPKAGICREDQVSEALSGAPNAVAVLKDASGEEVYAANVRVPTTLFYDYGHSATDGHNHDRGGALPEKSATFLFKFPRTNRTLEAKTIELKTFDGTYSQATALKSQLKRSVEMKSLKVGMK